MKKLLASERAAAIRLLKENLKEGDTLYTIVTKVNSMNSARWMRVLGYQGRISQPLELLYFKGSWV
jgi:hypothetical protein